MRFSIALAALFMFAAAAYADDVTLTLKKEGSCSGSITVTDRETHRTIASCGLTCPEKTVSVRAGTWVRVSAAPAARCGGGLLDPSSLCANRRGPCELQIPAADVVIGARFGWVWMH